MDQVAAQAIAIFQARTDSARVGLETRLAELEIESLDLALILLDLEDTFGIDFPYDPDKAGEAFATVGDVVKDLRALIEAKRQASRQGLAGSLVRSRSLWVAS